MNLQNIPDKTQYKDTTSHKFKQDLIDFFKEKNLKSCIEIGTNHGWTTRILSELFETVYTLDHKQSNIDLAKTNNFDKTNINYFVGDAYNSNTYIGFPKFDVAFIDCIHTYEAVINDINTCISLMDNNSGMYFIFDDYGHPQSTGVKDAILYAIETGLKVETYVGQSKGYQYNSSSTLIDREGIILSYSK
jgi:SAM-dependent methyltransferase